MLIATAILVEATAGQHLPIFIADNHAESSAWITRNFDLDEPLTLVLVDAHSDASAAERSEEIREELRRVPTEKDREKRVEKWRESGRVQAFNWIEPLMPRPIERVVWLPSPTLSGQDLAAKTSAAIEALDGRLEVEPRAGDSLAKRWETLDLKGFKAWQPTARRVVLSIDLDFFAGMTPRDREENFHAIWERALDWPGLAGVTFAISRPWLTDQAEADALVTLAVDAVRQTRGARLEIDASLDDRPDISLKAAELKNQVPRWDLEKASPILKVKLKSLGQRLAVTDRKRKWPATAWEDLAVSSSIVPNHGEIDSDEVWRYPLGNEPILRAESIDDATGKTRWFSLEPFRASYDLLPATGLGKSFSNSPGRWLYEKRRFLAETLDFQLDPSTWKRATGGRFLIGAELETPRGWIPLPAIELRIRTREGFLGSVSECGGMAYVFGIAGVVREDDLTGVESGWGSDCANMLIYGWRRNGIPLTWGDPGRLRVQLATVIEKATLADSIPISPEMIDRGCMIDFGKHVAVIWQDREPRGVLGGNDLVIHHLGGFPETVELAKLTATRPQFSIRVPIASPTCRVAFAGDVVMAGEDRHVMEGFGEAAVDAFVVNLEGIPSMADRVASSRYDFRFAPDKLDQLKAHGVTAVSLANNHACDAGPDGLCDGMKALENARIPYFGAGENEEQACRPWQVELKGVPMAFFGISYFETGAAGPDSPGIAALPRHQQLLTQEFQRARTAGKKIIVMVHGGEEYQTKVTAEQRQWARWLVARGANYIIGAHPHVIQRAEMHGGAWIQHSLGNAIYPRNLKGADYGMIRVLDIPKSQGMLTPKK